MSIEKMRIALVTGGLGFGGSTSFLLYLADGLHSLGGTAQVFSFTSENAFAAEFAAANVSVHSTDETKLIFEDRLMSLYQKIAEFDPTVAIANLAADSFEMLRYMPPGVTRMCMIHDPLNQKSLPIYEDFLDGIVTVNRVWLDTTRQIAAKVPSTYVAHGIPLPKAEIFRSPSDGRPLSITFFGRFNEGKGVRLFPGIIDQLHERGIPFQWVMYGSGPDENFLRDRLSKEIQKGEVLICPPVPRDELFSTIRKHDVFIMASHFEGGPFTLLEAMAVGLVPICNDTPCLVQEVVTPENGFIIALNPSNYVEAISLLHRDRVQLESMSSNARKIISERYGTRAMAGRYLDFIKSLAPEPVPVSWPARIKLKPILGSALLRISQGNSVARQIRRVLKRRKRST